jgi:hypothetical protein
MKSCYSLAVLAVLALLVSSPNLVSAQSVAPAAFQVSPAATPLYAQLDRPFSSSSSANAFFYNAPSAQAAAPAKTAAASDGSTRPFSSLGVGVTIGFGGVGFDVATPLVPGRLNVRGGAGFFSYTYNGTVSNEPISASLKLNNAKVMLDWFPFKGSFRLSAGTTVYNDTGLNGTVTVTSGTSLKIGNDYYLSDPSSPLTGNLGLGLGGKAVPRFTLGWGNMVAKNHRIRFETEFGVEIIGTPTVSWSYGGEACQTASSSSTTCSSESGYQQINTISGVSTDIATQVASLQSDVNSVKVLPVLQFGLSVKLGKK